jgi:hypothetical protein
MENYTPRHNDYAPLRAMHEEPSTDRTEEPIAEEASVQNEPTLETAQAPDLEPERPEKHYGQAGYAQGDGDYVSETIAATKNDQMINHEYHAAMAINQAAGRDAERDAVEPDITDAKTVDAVGDPEVSKQAEQYAQAHPDSGATEEELYNAAYFAKSVDDSERFPPRDNEEERLVTDRQSYEEIAGNLREGSGESRELSEEEQQTQMEDRMQAHISYQHRMSMSMSV